MNPADQSQSARAQRAADPPTLWLSLALGSVLIHLVLFILASLVSTHTAKVQLDIEPIAVEFVDPNAARSAASGGAIAVRPGVPSSRTPSSTQAQSSTPRSQPPAFNQPVEQPFMPLQPVKQRRIPVSPQPQQSSPVKRPTSPQPTSLRNSRQQQPNRSNQSQGRAGSGANSSQGRLPGSAPPPDNGTPGTTESQQAATSGDQIGQPPQGRSVTVVVSNPHQSVADALKQAARPIDLKKAVLINYPSALANRTIRLEASLDIEKDGLVVDVPKTTLLSPESGIDQDTVNDIAKQIFISSQWRFEPAQDDPGGFSVKPRRSNLIIDAQLQLP